LRAIAADLCNMIDGKIFSVLDGRYCPCSAHDSCPRLADYRREAH
jgi:hypothetical protein